MDVPDIDNQPDFKFDIIFVFEEIEIWYWADVDERFYDWGVYENDIYVGDISFEHDKGEPAGEEFSKGDIDDGDDDNNAIGARRVLQGVVF